MTLLVLAILLPFRSMRFMLKTNFRTSAVCLALLAWPALSAQHRAQAAPVPQTAAAPTVSQATRTTQADAVAQGAPPGTLAGVTFPDGPPAVSPAQQVTLAQAVATALRDNPQITQATHQVLSARNNLSGQRAPVNPTAGFANLNNTVTSINPADPSNYSFYGTVETSGRQRIRTQEARAQLEQSQADAQTIRLTVRQNATNAYIALQVANQSLLNEQEAYATSLRLRDLIRKQFELEAAPEADAIRAEIALTQEEQNLITAVGSVKQARATLNSQMGRAPDTPVDTSEPLAYTPLNVDLAQLQTRAELARPEIRSGEAQERELSATVKMQRSLYTPDLLLGTDARFRSVQLGFTAPLFDFGSIRGAVRKAREDVLAQRAETEQTRQQVRLGVQNAYDALQQARKSVLLYNNRERGILARSTSLLERVQQGYSLGASTVLDLITAQDTLRQARNSYYTALGNYRQAIAQVETAIGQPI